MAPIAILFGVLLTLLGGGFFVYTGMDKVTSLIPAFFGVPLIVLGVVARNEKYRMHAMHGAALLSLVGFGIPAFMVIKGLIRGMEATQGAPDFGPAQQEQAAMAVLCLIFLALCVKSFIDARIARKQKEAQTQPSVPPV
jgi:hypothetical protein